MWIDDTDFTILLLPDMVYGTPNIRHITKLGLIYMHFNVICKVYSEILLFIRHYGVSTFGKKKIYLNDYTFPQRI